MSDDLYYLQLKSISYIFAGKESLNFGIALTPLGELFPVNTIMLEGGGHINGSLLNEGLVDELSLLVLPIADGSPKSPTTFEVSEYLQKSPSTSLRLTEVQQLAYHVV